MKNFHTINLNMQAIKTFIMSHDLETQVEIINQIKVELHDISPFKNEPTDCVVWVKSDCVTSNDYNPNKVAPPEMQLLEISILNDGYTQPIVTWPHEDKIEVIDGFHRNRVGKESKIITGRVHGYLPIVSIRKEQSSKSDRIASTIRHNRARGKHLVNAMSDIVIELKNRNWTNERVARELGMDQDEVLRLCQISGLESLFQDNDFSRSWMIEDSELEFDPLTDEIYEEEKIENNFRTVNTSDENRIFHTYDKWECFKAGFYNSVKDGLTAAQCENEYFLLLTNENEFKEALEHVISEWKYSCEHYLTNISMNRIAWLGQASLCYAKGIPSTFRGGFNLLSKEQQERANEIALEYLNKWLERSGRPLVSLNEAETEKTTQIY